MSNGNKSDSSSSEIIKNIIQYGGIISGSGAGFAAICFGIGFLAIKSHDAMLGFPTTTTVYTSYVRVGALFFPNSIYCLIDTVLPYMWKIILAIVLIIILTVVFSKRPLKLNSKASLPILLVVYSAAIILALISTKKQIDVHHPINQNLLFKLPVLDYKEEYVEKINSILESDIGKYVSKINLLLEKEEEGSKLRELCRSYKMKEKGRDDNAEMLRNKKFVSKINLLLEKGEDSNTFQALSLSHKKNEEDGELSSDDYIDYIADIQTELDKGDGSKELLKLFQLYNKENKEYEEYEEKSKLERNHEYIKEINLLIENEGEGTEILELYNSYKKEEVLRDERIKLFLTYKKEEEEGEENEQLLPNEFIGEFNLLLDREDEGSVFQEPFSWYKEQQKNYKREVASLLRKDKGFFTLKKYFSWYILHTISLVVIVIILRAWHRSVKIAKKDDATTASQVTDNHKLFHIVISWLRPLLYIIIIVKLILLPSNYGVMCISSECLGVEVVLKNNAKGNYNKDGKGIEGKSGYLLTDMSVGLEQIIIRCKDDNELFTYYFIDRKDVEQIKITKTLVKNVLVVN